MIIREEKAGETEIIYQLVKKAFAYAEHSDGNEHHLVTKLRKSDAYIPALSLVAEKNGEIVGHIMFTRATVQDCEVLALAPLSVLPEYQMQGVGSALIQEGHNIAKKLGFGYSVVLGSENYYPKFGYVTAEKHGIKAPFDVPQENFMVKKIDENAPKICGVIKYAIEFGID